VKEVKMEKDIKDYTKQNRKAWNEVMPKHQAASKERLDQLFANVMNCPNHIVILLRHNSKHILRQ
jgi:hypothetical protein